MEILDYSQSEIIFIESGIGKIQTGYFRILHFIDVDEYATTLEQIKTSLRNNIPPSHPLLPFLLEDIRSITSLINRLTLSKRHTRAINEIGTVWKWLAGSPDHDDFQILADKMNNVIENNNNQIIINERLIEQVNNVTITNNKILKSLKSNENMQNTLILNEKYKIDVIKEKIKNINIAIQLSKSNIVNTFMLSDEEMLEVEKIFYDDNIPFMNLEFC